MRAPIIGRALGICLQLGPISVPVLTRHQQHSILIVYETLSRVGCTRQKRFSSLSTVEQPCAPYLHTSSRLTSTAPQHNPSSLRPYNTTSGSWHGVPSASPCWLPTTVAVTPCVQVVVGCQNRTVGGGGGRGDGDGDEDPIAVKARFDRPTCQRPRRGSRVPVAHICPLLEISC